MGYQRVSITILAEDVPHPKGRVVVFDISPRPVGRRVKSDGHYRYPIRKGESIVEMDDEDTKAILNEVQPDFSSGIIESFAIGDIDERAVGDFKKRMAEKTGNHALVNSSTAQILQDAELMRGGKFTLACLILLGKKEKIAERHR